MVVGDLLNLIEKKNKKSYSGLLIQNSSKSIKLYMPIKLEQYSILTVPKVTLEECYEVNKIGTISGKVKIHKSNLAYIFKQPKHHLKTTNLILKKISH